MKLTPLLCALCLTATTAFAQDPAPAEEEKGTAISDLFSDHDYGEFRQALADGRVWLNLRYRYEDVDRPGAAAAGDASTLRTVLGYETGAYHGFRGLLEVEDVARVDDRGAFPTIPDPLGTNVNQAYLQYEGVDAALFRAGRQEVILDNARWVGNVGWRQHHQSLDAVMGMYTGIENLTAKYSWVHSVNRINGASLDTTTHLFNVGYDVEEVGKVTGYFYYLDLDDAQMLSSSTVGIRFAGAHPFGQDAEGEGGWKLTYAAEFADQKDAGGNPVDLDQEYHLLEVGAQVNGYSAKVATEHLGGSGTMGDSLQTPLATLHAHNGFADVFLNTPAAGLEDMNVKVAAKMGKAKLGAAYHVFESDAGSADYGKELDVSLTYALNSHTVFGAKYADFNADDVVAGIASTRKLWFWVAYALL
jgi:hypothetical protein